jgi:hypothetical protein
MTRPYKERSDKGRPKGGRALEPNTVDWYHNKKHKDPTSRLERILLTNNTKQEQLLRKVKIPKDMPKGNFSTVFGYKKKRWEKMGYKCNDCAKVLIDEHLKDKHVLICKNQKKINKSEDIEMPVQVVTIDGQRMYRWGNQGKLYRTREEAEAQAQAIYASGYKEDDEEDDEE